MLCATSLQATTEKRTKKTNCPTDQERIKRIQLNANLWTHSIGSQIVLSFVLTKSKEGILGPSISLILYQKPRLPITVKMKVERAFRAILLIGFSISTAISAGIMQPLLRHRKSSDGTYVLETGPNTPLAAQVDVTLVNLGLNEAANQVVEHAAVCI